MKAQTKKFYKAFNIKSTEELTDTQLLALLSFHVMDKSDKATLQEFKNKILLSSIDRLENSIDSDKEPYQLLIKKIVEDTIDN